MRRAIKKNYTQKIKVFYSLLIYIWAKNTSSLRTIRDWNSLPDHVKEASTIEGFKKQLINTMATSYHS